MAHEKLVQDVAAWERWAESIRDARKGLENAYAPGEDAPPWEHRYQRNRAVDIQRSISTATLRLKQAEELANEGRGELAGDLHYIEWAYEQQGVPQTYRQSQE